MCVLLKVDILSLVCFCSVFFLLDYLSLFRCGGYQSWRYQPVLTLSKKKEKKEKKQNASFHTTTSWFHITNTSLNASFELVYGSVCACVACVEWHRSGVGCPGCNVFVWCRKEMGGLVQGHSCVDMAVSISPLGNAGSGAMIHTGLDYSVMNS